MDHLSCSRLSMQWIQISVVPWICPGAEVTPINQEAGRSSSHLTASTPECPSKVQNLQDLGNPPL